MKVSELIKELQEFDGDLPVVTEYKDTGDYLDLTVVSAPMLSSDGADEGLRLWGTPFTRKPVERVVTLG